METENNNEYENAYTIYIEIINNNAITVEHIEKYYYSFEDAFNYCKNYIYKRLVSDDHNYIIYNDDKIIFNTLEDEKSKEINNNISIHDLDTLSVYINTIYIKK